MFVIGFFFVYFLLNQDKKRFSNVIKVQHSDSLNGIVKYRISNKGTVVVRFENNFEYQIPASVNDNYHPSFIDNFISVYDSIYKHPFSDTVFVERDDKTYFFIIK